MELLDVVNQIVFNALQAYQPTDLVIGTVQSVSPLAVKLETNQAVIRQEVLFRTDAVVERKIKIEKHAHSTSEGTTSLAKSEVTSFIDGKAQAEVGGYIILNKGLAAGDKVLLLSVQQGQKYIILSRIV